MQEVSATDFKAQCLALMDEVAETGKELTITKRGKPVAKLVPVHTKVQLPIFGALKGRIEFAYSGHEKPLFRNMGSQWKLAEQDG